MKRNAFVSISANLSGLMLILLIAWLSRNYLAAFFRGPEHIDQDSRLIELAEQVSEEGGMFYIELGPRQLIPTDWSAVATNDDTPYATNPYYLLAAGDRWMLIMTPPDPEGKPLVGPLQELASPVDREVWESLWQERPELRGHLLPVVLNSAAAFNVIGYLGLGFGVPLALFFGFNLVRSGIQISRSRLSTSPESDERH